MRLTPLIVCLLSWCVACGDDDVTPRVDAGDPDGGFTRCRSDDQCSDGVFCNGIERCMAVVDEGDGDGCVPGTPPRCDDGLDCTVDSCSHLSNGCRFTPIDRDGDGHAAATCMTTDGEALGDDCDDDNAQRFAGNAETCTAETEATDEDCNADTIGVRDADGDGAVDDACCNGDHCGDDCNDQRADVAAGYPEICDLIDNDCDGDADVNTVEADWYVDFDRDGFGSNEQSALRSCAPIAGRSLFNTDLDDRNAAINPAAIEVCDGVDNDCDGSSDEGDVCICGRPGSAPCECVSGISDCYGGLIPRSCVGGHWVTQAACRGRTPMCVMGECVCVGGGTACTAVLDRSPPLVIAASPGTGQHVAVTTVISILLSEEVDPASLLTDIGDPTSLRGDVFHLRLAARTDDVSASLTIEGNLLVLTPEAPLLPGRVYGVMLSGVTDVAGNPLSASYGFNFSTAPLDYDRERVGGGAETRTLVGPLQLDTNTDGEAVLSVGYLMGNSGATVVRHAIFARSIAGQWTRHDIDTADTDVPQVAIGDGDTQAGTTGTLYALNARSNDTTTAFFRGPNDSDWTTQPIIPRTLRSLALGGRESCVVTGFNTGLTFHVPSTMGGYDAFSTSTATAIADLAAAGNASRRYAAISTGATTELHLWQPAPSTFVNDATYSALGGGSTQPAITINDSGRAVATWIELAQRAGAGGGTPPVLTQMIAFIGDLDQSGSPIALDAGTTTPHDLPRVTWLSDGSVLALHRDSARVVARRIDAQGTISAPMRLGEDIGGPLAGGFAAVSLGNGNALVAWVNGTSLAGSGFSLIVARYRDRRLEPSEIIADASVAGSVALAPLPNAAALLVWETGTPEALAVVLQ